MAMYKFIHWRDDIKPDSNGNRWANVHLLVGYNRKTITDLQEMARELRKTFPQAKNRDIVAGMVYKSDFCDNFTLIAWNSHIPAGDYPGWTQKDIEWGEEYSYH